MTIAAVASYTVLGMPLIMLGGIVTLLCFLFTASISIMNKRGTTFIPFKWHPRMAAISIALAISHAIMGFGFMLGF